MVIYLVTNDVNNKVYIGQTTKDLQTRIQGHYSSMRAGQDTHLYRAMRKYGWSHFRFQVIDTAASQVELDEKERFYIDKYNSISCGYNMVEGGRANPMSSAVVRDKHLHKMQDDDVRNKIRQSVVSNLKAEGGRSAEYRRTCLESKKAFYQTEAGERAKEKFRKSFKFSPEHYKALNDAKNNSVYCVDEAGNVVEKFDRVKDAAVWWYEHGYIVKDLNGLCDRIKQSSKELKYIRGLLWVYCV